MSKLTQQGQVFKKNPHPGPFLLTSQSGASLPRGALPSRGPKSRPRPSPCQNTGLRAALICFSRSRTCVSAITFQTGALLAGVGGTPGCRLSPLCVDTAVHAAQPPAAGAPSQGKGSCPRHAQAAWGLNPSSNPPGCVIWAIGKSSLCLSVPICKGGDNK